MARILLADDDQDYGRAFQSAIKSLGHKVTIATTGAEAVDVLRNNTDSFDIIFLDVMMPGGGAASVLHKLPEIKVTAPVVVITGRAELYDSPLFKSGLRLAKERIKKSATLEEIESLITRLTGK